MLNKLPPRERQIVDLLFERGEMAVADICEALPVQLSGSAVRAMLRILEEKGHVRHEQDGPRYVYLPTVGRDNAKNVDGRKRHIVTDTQGHLVGLRVHPADIQDRDGAAFPDRLEMLAQPRFQVGDADAFHSRVL